MGLSAKDTLGILLKQMEGFINTKTVVGEPVHIDDTIILPLVDVSFGVGAGANEKDKEKKDSSSAGVGGLGAKISPSAVLVVKDGNTKLVNIKKQDSVTKLLDLVPEVIDKFSKGKKVENSKAVDDKVEEFKNQE